MKRLSKLVRGCIILTLGGLLAGCAFGPSGQPPAQVLPVQYGVTTAIDKTVSAQGVVQQFTPSQLPQVDWWTLYGSPDLNALVAEGLGNNLDLASADQRLAAAYTSWQAQSGASQLPSIDMGAQAARQRDVGLPMPGSSTVLYNSFVGQAQVRYTFDLFGAIRYQNKALAERVNQQAHQLEAARNALAANIVSASISIAGLRAQANTVQRLIILTQQDADDITRQYALGAASRATMLEARRRVAALAAQLPEVQARLLAARHALAVLLGRTPDQAPPELMFSQLAVPDSIPVLVPTALLASRPDIQAAEAALRAAAADVGQATASMFPQLTLGAAMGRGGFDWSTAVSGAGAIWSMAASVTQPIFHGGALRAQRKAAMLRYDVSVSMYKQTVLSVFQEVADRLAALEQDNLALAQADTARVATQELYVIAQTRVQLGALPASSARSLAQQHAQAELDTLRYAMARLLDTTALFHAMGQLPD